MFIKNQELFLRILGLVGPDFSLNSPSNLTPRKSGPSAKCCRSINRLMLDSQSEFELYF